MLANRIRETTTSTGTANITLAGAESNFRTFSAAFALNVRFRYLIVDEVNTTWEVGKGYLSAATTLVREEVLDNASGTTSTINLASGSKTVICSADDAALLPALSYVASIQEPLFTGSNLGGSRSAQSDQVANRIYYVAVLLSYGGQIDAFAVRVMTAAASSMARVGLYSVGSDGLPDQLIIQSGDLDTTTTGMTFGTFTARHLLPGWYYLGYICNSTGPAVQSLTPIDNVSPATPCGMFTTRLEPISYVYENLVSGWTSMPATAGTVSSVDSIWRRPPIAYLRAA